MTTSRLLLVAAPTYLRRHGTPKTPEALAQHATLSFALGLGRHWVLARHGERRAVDVTPRLLATSSDAVREAALAGAGIAMLPTFLVDDALARGALRIVLPSWDIGTLRIYALHPNRRTHPARLRVFLDALVERFGPDPEADGFVRAP